MTPTEKLVAKAIREERADWVIRGYIGTPSIRQRVVARTGVSAETYLRVRSMVGDQL